MNNKDKKNGFTYVELLGVIAIIGIITLIALPIINRVQEKNKTTKYKTYAEALKNSGKLYTDSYSKDMFGYAKNGCYDIKYSQLKEKNLIQDIKINDITCGNDDKTTFVRVIKSKDNYKYEVAIECKDKKDEIVYENKLSPATCDGKEDEIAPEITISPTNMDWTKGENERVTAKVYDFYRLMENQKIKYAWTTTPETIAEDEYTTISFENKRGVNEAKVEIPLPTNKTGLYYLVIQPIEIKDLNENIQTNKIQSEIFKLDNTQPTTAYVNKNTLRCTGCEEVTYKCDRENYSSEFNNCTIITKYIPGSSNMVTYYGFIREDNLSGAKPYSDEYQWYSDGKNAKNQTNWTTQAPTEATRDCGENYTKCYIDLRYYDNAGNVSNTLRTYFVNK